MQLKVFTAPELHEALAQVRDALGPDALILDRQVETASDGSRSWKVYAAVDAEDAGEDTSPQPPLLHAMQRLERLVDGIARKEATGLRNNLESPAARLAFDSLLEIGTSPSHAFDIADDFAEGRPLSCPALSWGERLSPQTQREVVALTEVDGQEFARGLVNYEADELRRIRGAKTTDIERTLGYRGVDEVVHRDNLVIL